MPKKLEYPVLGTAYFNKGKISAFTVKERIEWAKYGRTFPSLRNSSKKFNKGRRWC
ncbi:hypothetical protein [Candidatus Endomicrobiellum agilis]|jgi:hypothetical protein|uniref:hypothetical protein n=1 Tax=Candidatus Endomicrobiellum agilis TaxID=3238957 RepID=UPI0035A984D5